MTARYVLALDEGTSSARAVLVDADGELVADARASFTLRYPHPGWVEVDPVELWEAQASTIHAALGQAGVRASEIAAVGITTHRETLLMWDRATGAPIHHAIMWMSQQTDPIIRQWSAAGLDEEIRNRTGLHNDSYYSAGKLAWLLAHVPGARARAQAGELAAGTVDAWLLSNLTGGAVHATDHSCASRTALFNLDQLAWDEELCSLLDLPVGVLPSALPSDSAFGVTDPALLGAEIPITAVIADQQAGLYGQACFEPGAAKNTFGTAGVLTINAGERPFLVPHLTTSVAWSAEGSTAYEAEGVVFSSGQTISWLRDNLKILPSTDEVEALAMSVPDNGGVYLVPAFAGLAAPHWARDARAAIVGLSLSTDVAHVVRAGVESIAYQTRDNVDAFVRQGHPVTSLKVDGGAVGNDLLCQFQADLLGIEILRPRGLERTALGAAFLAGSRVGLWNGMADVAARWQRDRVFVPQMGVDQREELYAGWQSAVRSAIAHEA